MSHLPTSIQRADPAAARPAGVCGYWLGGADYDQADREAAEEVIRHYPEVTASARAGRAFGRRVSWYAAGGCVIRQLLDIGAGFLAPDATHITVRRASRGCRVVYADNDPLVVDRSRFQVMAETGCAGDYICADVRDPVGLLAQAGDVLDFAEPVAVLLLGVLHFVPDADDPAGIVAGLAAALAPGSLVTISHLTADFAPGPVGAGVGAWNKLVSAPLYPRGEAQVTGMFGDLPLTYPGVMRASGWRPSFRSPGPDLADMYGGVAAVPRPGGSQ